MNPKVDFYFNKANLPGGKAVKWQKELGKLRSIILDCGLTEELKWGVPCYAFQKSNIMSALVTLIGFEPPFRFHC